MAHGYPRAWYGRLHDIGRTFTVEGGLTLAAQTLGSKAPTADIFEAELITLMDSDRPIVINLGNGTRKATALLVKWEAEQTNDDVPTYTLTFRQAISADQSETGQAAGFRRPSIAEARTVIMGGTLQPTPPNTTAVLADDFKMTITIAGMCPECGPHGNAGRVALLTSVVDCLTCRA